MVRFPSTWAQEVIASVESTARKRSSTQLIEAIGLGPNMASFLFLFEITGRSFARLYGEKKQHKIETRGAE
jgi:hypothetical protein